MSVKNFFALYFVFLSLIFPSVVCAESLDLSGHIKLQPNFIAYDSNALHRAFGTSSQFRQDFDSRILSNFEAGDLEFEFHTDFLASAGSAVDANRSVTEFLGAEYQPFGSDRRRVFDIEGVWLESSDFIAAARADRANVKYRTQDLAISVGREAISFGNGLIFQVSDLFNPFSPVEIDKDYKVGDDLIYAQYLFSDGSDLEALIVPRRSLDSGHLRDEESSFALKYRSSVDAMGYDLLLGQHYNEAIIGIAMEREFASGIARMDTLLLLSETGELRPSYLVNYDRSWFLFGKNVYGLVEYYYSGFGVDEGSYSAPSADLAARQARGELFTLNKQYLSSLVQVELSPLLNSFLLGIWNIRDRSGLAQLRFMYNLSQDSDIQFGVNVPLGPSGTEFGGVPLAVSPDSEMRYLSSSVQAYVRAGWYF